MSRLLTNFVLLRNHYPFIIFKKVERKQYVDTLSKADDNNFKASLSSKQYTSSGNLIS
jgi:hypothetical protein